MCIRRLLERIGEAAGAKDGDDETNENHTSANADTNKHLLIHCHHPPSVRTVYAGRACGTPDTQSPSAFHQWTGH